MKYLSLSKLTVILCFCIIIPGIINAQDQPAPPDPPPPPDPPLPQPNCTTFNPGNNETCKISGMTYTQASNETLNITYDGPIEIQNSNFNCTDECGVDNDTGDIIYRWENPLICCRIVIKSTNSTVIIGTTSIKFSNIEIYASSNLTVDPKSTLDTTGMGYIEGPGFFNNLTGGCYAAQAGFCTDNTVPINLTYSSYFQLPDSTNSKILAQQFGSGAGTNLTLGGGRIVILGRSLSLGGELRANGTPAILDINQTTGGSGGYIYIGLLPSTDTTYSQKVSIFSLKAEGGKGQLSGGSGGRIILDIQNQTLFNSTSSFKVSAVGGGNDTTASGTCAYIGGPGTIFFKNESLLQVYGSLNIQISLLAKALITGADPSSSDFQNLTNLVLKNAAISFNTVNNYSGVTNASVQQINLIQSSIKSILYGGTQVFSLKSTNITLSTSLIDTLNVNYTQINASIITLDALSAIKSGQYMNLYGDFISIKGGSLSAKTLNPSKQQKKVGAQAQTNSQILILANSLFTLLQTQSAVQISTDMLVIYSRKDVLISGQIGPQNSLQTCSSIEDAEVFSFVQSQIQLPLDESSLLINYQSQFNIGKSFTIYDFQQQMLSNFTYVIIALSNFNLSSQGYIRTSRFASYANNTLIEGSIDTSYSGCNGGVGMGKGKSTTNLCTASGGSHGGDGGKAVLFTPGQGTDPCNQFASQSYGQFDSFAVLEGSGGGSVTGTQGSSPGTGGGYIWMQADTVTLNNARLFADGGPSNDAQGSGSGAGAGGTIMLAINQLIGNATVSAGGGSAMTQLGGGGAGGRVKFYLFSWFEKEMYSVLDLNPLNITVNVTGGNGETPIQNGKNGTVWSTPCAPGYFGLFCLPCQIGYFKTEYSNIECKICDNMPNEAINNSAYYTTIASDTPMCPYECPQSYVQFDSNAKCLNNLDLFFESMGGIKIFILIIVATIFAIIAIIYFLMVNNKNENLEDDENLNKLKLAFEELDFIQRDLHQHICRLYLVGHNELKSPWVMPVMPPVQLRQRIHLDRYQDFAKRINSSDKRPKMERTLNLLLNFIYPPVQPLYLKKKRREHYYSFKKAFIAEAEKIDFWKSYEDQLNIELRFTSSDDYTLAYVDFLDIKRTRDMFDKPPLPMTILISGTGSFSKPYQIKRDDPLVRSINYYLEDTVVWDMFLANLNSNLLALCLQNFGFLFKWRLFKTMDFIDEYSKKLFERKGFKLNLWLLEAKSLSKCGGVEEDGHEASFIDSLDQPEEYYILSQGYLKRKRDVMTNLISYWRTESFYNPLKVFKLALVITKIDSTPSEVVSNNVVKELKKGVTYRGGKANERTSSNIAAWKGGASRVSQEQQTNNVYDNYVHLLIGSVKENHIDHTRVKIFKNYKYGMLRTEQEQENPVTWREMTRHVFKQALMLPIALIRTLTLRHSRIVRYFMIAAILYTISVIVDVVVTAVLVNYIFSPNQKPQLRIAFLSIYPLASILSPLTGVISMMLCKPFFYRAMSYMNSLSIFGNLFAYLIAELIIQSFNEQRFYYALILLATKLSIAELLSIQIAYFRNPKYHIYKEKLTQIMEEARQQDQQYMPSGIDMDMVLEAATLEPSSERRKFVGYNARALTQRPVSEMPGTNNAISQELGKSYISDEPY